MPVLSDLAYGPERVFPTHARIERYYPSAAAEEARRVLARCLRRGEGPALLVGAPGTGKSMLLHVLADELSEERTVACLTSAQLSTRRALLQSILFELGQSYRQRDEGELRLALVEYLSSPEVAPRGIVLLVDEAQALPTRLLEELRVLGNLAHNGEPQVRLLLAGSQALDEKFTSPEVETFNQRIVARCYLAPFSHHDTAQYIRGHLAAAGGDPNELFTAGALDAAFHATDGIARLVNQVCDRALLLAAGHGQLQVDKQIMQGAWADLQQLPTPWNLPDTNSGAADEPEVHEVVEFGPLSGDDSTFAAGEPEGLPDEDHQEPFATVFELAAEASIEGSAEESPSLTHESVENSEPVQANEPVMVQEDDIAASTPAGSDAPAPSVADPFGGGFDEEEVVIDDYAPLEATMPASRPQVTNQCEAEISSLLHGVMQPEEKVAADIIVEPLTEIETAKIESDFITAYTGLSVVDGPELDAQPFEEEPNHEDGVEVLDPTELDEETAELEYAFDRNGEPAGETIAIVSASAEAVEADEFLAGEGVELLVIDDDAVEDRSLAAVHREDYKQLFSSLLRN